MNTILIMAGGVGTRFWPLSRIDKPKQFLRLTDKNKSMLQNTINRVKKLVEIDQIFIATNKNYKDKIIKQIPDIPEENIIIEPYKRNTAPCIGLAAFYIKNKFPDSTMIVLPSDHEIKDEENFINVLKNAALFAKQNKNIITIGIKPNSPETGYGYIKAGNIINTSNGKEAYEVEKFTEKPDIKTAQNFLAEGNYYWNSGMFIWNIDTIIDKIRVYLPKLYNSLIKINKNLGTLEEKEIINQQFFEMESISIDYGVLEKEKDIFVIPGNFGWNDVGSWTALSNIKEKDNLNNIIEGEFVGIDSKDTIIYSDNKLVTAIGVDNLIIVNTEDAILVCNKSKAQNVKKLRNVLKEKGLDKYL